MNNTFERPISFRPAHMLLFILGLLVVLALFIPSWNKPEESIRESVSRGSLTTLEQNNIKIFEASSPAVVYITTLSERVNYWTRDITRIPQGTGSGFIWDRHGHIITNYHVLQGASAVKVHLSDQRTFDAKLVGSSPEHDLAVLRISMGKNIPKPLPLGTSEDLKVGQLTYAIGNPFGLDQTLTTGVVSALNRSLSTGNGSMIEGLIQTDAAINPGNSGGPLLDSAGRLMGINTAIYSPSGAYAGIGFAVPVDTVGRIIPKIIAHGDYKRPKLGITINDQLNKMANKKLGIDGVAVIDVRPYSSAYRSGLRGVQASTYDNVIYGDIIIGINEDKITNNKMLLSTLEKYNVGDKIKVKVLRGKKEKELSLTLE